MTAAKSTTTFKDKYIHTPRMDDDDDDDDKRIFIVTLSFSTPVSFPLLFLAVALFLALFFYFFSFACNICFPRSVAS